MVSAKALAAIGLTLVIVIPIGLGYVLALEETESQVWQSSGGSSLSDMLLNSETPYYTDYTGPSNNSQMVLTKYSPGAGTWTEIGAPDYVTVGTTYTSIPEYSETTGSKTLASSVTANYTMQAGDSVGVGMDTQIAVGDYMYLTVTSSATSVHWQFTYDGVPVMSTKSPVTAIRDAADSWTLYGESLPDGKVSGARSFGYETDADGTLKVVRGTYTSLGISGSYSMALQSYGLRLTLTGGGVQYLAYSGSLGAIVVSSAGTVQADGQTVKNVASVALVTSAGTSSVSYTSVTATGRYAFVEDGWTVPASVSAAWFNGHSNGAVTIYAKIPAGSTVSLTKQSGNVSGTTLYIENTGDTLEVGDTALGAYDTVRVVVDLDGYTVTGIRSWPPFGSEPTEYSSVKLSAATGLIDRIKIGGDTATYRVDTAYVLAGHYASTKDYTLDVEALYPDKAVEITLSSIGVYGTSVRIGGTSYAVTDGKITVGGTPYALKGLRISAIPEGSSYLLKLNGISIGSSASPAVYLGGEWSIGAYVATMEQVTVKSLEWQPGGWGIDKETMGAAGLLACIVAFVTLGVVGKHSGVKIGLLGLVLGGAALTFFIII